MIVCYISASFHAILLNINRHQILNLSRKFPFDVNKTLSELCKNALVPYVEGFVYCIQVQDMERLSSHSSLPSTTLSSYVGCCCILFTHSGPRYHGAHVTMNGTFLKHAPLQSTPKRNLMKLLIQIEQCLPLGY